LALDNLPAEYAFLASLYFFAAFAKFADLAENKVTPPIPNVTALNAAVCNNIEEVIPASFAYPPAFVA